MPLPLPLGAVPAPLPRQLLSPIQPRQAPPQLNPYMSISLAYPTYLYYGRGSQLGRQTTTYTSAYPGYYNPTPNYNYYNINVNLPFAGTAS